MNVLDGLLRHLRYAARSLRQSAATTVASVLTLALGMGANTAMFSVLYGVVLRPLPYGHPDALVQIHATKADGATQNISLPEFDDWKRRSQSFAETALFSMVQFALDRDEATDAVQGAVVSDRFFPLLDTPMLLGRPLGPEDDETTAIVVSERLWRSRLNGDSGAVGRTLRLNGATHTVIGVAPAALQLPSADTDLWAPIGFARLSAPPQWTMRGFRAFSIIARLEPGVGLARSRSDTSRIAAELSREYPRFNTDLGATVTPLRDRIAGPVRPALLMLFAAVALVLLVACANLANLALARGVARTREMAIRTAIGASRRHVMAQVFAESALVAVGGTMLGLLLAQAVLTLIATAPPPGIPRLGDVRLDAPVLLFTGALGVLSVLLFGTAPAVRLSRTQPGTVLQETRMASPGTRRLHATLVALQIAASLVLLVGSAMLARSLAALLRVDVGIRAEGVLTARLDLTSGAFADPVRQTAFLDRLLSDLSAIPGVGAAGIVSSLPPSVSQMHTTMSARNPRTGQPEDVAIEMIAASPHVFGALGVPLIRGRLFSPADTAGTPRVVVLGDRLARRLFPDEDPIGRSIAVGPSQPGAPLPVVVGVVGDVKYSGLDKAPDGAVYMPYGQRPFRATYVIVRTMGDRRGVTAALQKAIHAIDPGVAVGRILDLDAVVSVAAAQPALRTWLLAGLSGLALLLAAVGLYGVTAYGVTQRTAEIGLRSALGADRTSLLLMILRQGLGVMVAGLAVGAVAALAMAETLSAFLYDVQPTDATSFAIATACMLLAGLVATLVPAWRATRIEPLAALRG